MTNREKLTKTNEYDLLCSINEKLPCYCVMQFLEDARKPGDCDNRCPECIAKWLNEEASE